MFEKWSVVTTQGGPRSVEDLRQIYGQDAIITPAGRFNLVHLDHPDPEEVQRRLAEFDPDELFEDDCPLCCMLREEGGEVVYEAQDTDLEGDLEEDLEDERRESRRLDETGSGGGGSGG